MTISLALPKSPESLSFLAGLEGENARKTAGSEAADGFAQLLDQLAAMPPATKGEPGADAADLQARQEIELPTGKSLPLAAFVLPVLEAEAADAGDSEAADIDPEALVIAAMLPVVGDASEPLAAPAPGAVVAKDAGADAARAAASARLPGEPVAAPALQEPKAAQPNQAFEVRIAAAQAPRVAPLADAASAVENGKARIDLPTAIPAAVSAVVADKAALAAGTQAARTMPVQDGPAAKAELATDARPAATEPRMAVAGRADSAALPATPADDRKGTQSDAGSDNAANPPRAAVQLDTPKMQVLAGRTEDSVSAAPAHSAPQRTVVADPVSQVERVVEQLMAARQVDLTKPTAIAVAHKEFGALTVTFDPSANGMNVEVAAQDSDAHRALAAAMAGDRSAPRQQDTAAQTAATSHQTGQAGADRGGASNQAGTGFGQGSADHQRSQHADQRGRHGDRPANQKQPASSSSSDDALYA